MYAHFFKCSIRSNECAASMNRFIFARRLPKETRALVTCKHFKNNRFFWKENFKCICDSIKIIRIFRLKWIKKKKKTICQCKVRVMWMIFIINSPVNICISFITQLMCWTKKKKNCYTKKTMIRQYFRQRESFTILQIFFILLLSAANGILCTVC